jgi:hypothetical protein
MDTLVLYTPVTALVLLGVIVQTAAWLALRGVALKVKL